MLIDVANDVHTDLWNGGSSSVNWEKARNEGSDVLVLAGDTSNYLEDLEHVLEQVSAVYKHVVFTDGNHEHYFWGNDVDDLEEYLADLSLKFPNVTYLNGKNIFRIGRTVFIGCNGWYDFRVHEPRWSVADSMRAWNHGSNDPRMINFGKTPVGVRAVTHASWIEGQVQDLQDEDVDIVVVTHTIPSKVLAQWSKYTNTTYAVLDGAYYNTAMEGAYFVDVNKRIKVWVYGHTHQRLDKTVGHVRYVNNARGYQSENNEMGRWFVAQIDTEDKGYE